MRLLVSFDKFNEYLDLDTNKRYIINDNNYKNYGYFKYVNGGLSMLFVSQKKLYLKYNDYCVNILEITECDITNMSGYIALFSASDSNGNKISFSYELDKSLYNIAPFDYIDEEDYDWGLFLSNIIKTPSRINNIILNNA